MNEEMEVKMEIEEKKDEQTETQEPDIDFVTMLMELEFK